MYTFINSDKLPKIIYGIINCMTINLVYLTPSICPTALDTTG